MGANVSLASQLLYPNNPLGIACNYFRAKDESIVLHEKILN